MATFKSKMRHLETDWADRIWGEAQACNSGNGAAWLLPLAALAITGARPVSLERGIKFEAKRNADGGIILVAFVPGAKLLTDSDGSPKRGQKMVQLTWNLSVLPGAKPPTHRPEEFAEIANAVYHSPQRSITIQYDAEAISTRLRELSQKIWPRRRYHVSGICYRQLFAAESKASGISSGDLAAAMGHISAESQGKYASGRRSNGRVTPANRTFSNVEATTPVRIERSPMSRFKRNSALKRSMEQ